MRLSWNSHCLSPNPCCANGALPVPPNHCLVEPFWNKYRECLSSIVGCNKTQITAITPAVNKQQIQDADRGSPNHHKQESWIGYPKKLLYEEVQCSNLVLEAIVRQSWTWQTWNLPTSKGKYTVKVTNCNEWRANWRCGPSQPQAVQRRVGRRIGYQNNFAMHKSNATYAPITYIQPTINEIVNNLGFDKLETLQPCQRATW